MKQKIWILTSKSGSSKIFKTESSFLQAINGYHKNHKVTIFQEIESYDNAFEFSESFIKNREREEGLKILLDNNSTIQLIYKFKEELSDSHPTINMIIKRKFKIFGNTIEAFKKIVSESEIRKFLLYRSRKDIEWYKLLLQIHNFKFDIESEKNIKEEDKLIRRENFNKAKEEIKKIKK
jgi:hypothetical protein